MRRVFAQARKELIQLVRDRLSLGLALVLPAFMLLLMGTAFSLTVHDMPIVVQDFDGSLASEHPRRLSRFALVSHRALAGQLHPARALTSSGCAAR